MAYDNTTVIRVSHYTMSGGLLKELSAASTEPKAMFNALAKWFERLACGIDGASVEVVLNGALAARASATATFASVVATDTLTINGVTFTCVAGGAGANEFNVGGTDTITATNCAAAINASVTAKVAGYVTASSSGTVVTIRSKQPGLAGNLFTVAQTGGTITLNPLTALGSGTGDNVTATTYSRS